jgi:hypothetical protein
MRNVTSVAVHITRHLGDGRLEVRREVRVDADAPPPDDAAPRYLLLDGVLDGNDTAFGHWHAECAVFLTQWAALLRAHPTLRVVIRSERVYKRLALALYGVPQERVVHEADVTVPNVCLLPPRLLMNDAALPVPTFRAWWDAHVDALRAAAGVGEDDDNAAPRTPVLVLPRQSRENFAANDRTVEGYPAVSAWAEARGGRTLHTDTVTDFGEQVRAVASARAIVCDYGSSFLVNGSLARNADIVVVGSLFNIHSCVSIAESMRARGNRLHFIRSLADAPAALEAALEW